MNLTMENSWNWEMVAGKEKRWPPRTRVYLGQAYQQLYNNCNKHCRDGQIQTSESVNIKAKKLFRGNIFKSVGLQDKELQNEGKKKTKLICKPVHYLIQNIQIQNIWHYPKFHSLSLSSWDFLSHSCRFIISINWVAFKILIVMLLCYIVTLLSMV